MQINPTYDDVIKEISDFLKERAEFSLFCDIKKENIIIDPGIGFGKRTGNGVEDNCEILRRLSELKNLGFPVMIGASRKKFIGNVCGGDDPLLVSDRLEGSLAAACLAVINGVNIVRVTFSSLIFLATAFGAIMAILCRSLPIFCISFSASCNVLISTNVGL